MRPEEAFFRPVHCPVTSNRYLEDKVAFNKLQLGVVAAARTVRAGGAWQRGASVWEI